MKHLSVFEKRVLFVALVAHLIAAWCSVGFHHPDEHYQLVEFAYYKLGRTTVDKLPWEFPAEIRPGLQPYMAYLLLKSYYALGFKDPYDFAFLLRLLTGITTLCTAWFFHKTIAPQLKSDKFRKIHLVLSVLGWGLVYVHVRFSSETWSAMAFAWALIALWRPGKANYWLFGLFMGLSFVFRFQVLFMIAGAGLWMLFVARLRWKDIVKVAAGFAISFLVGLLCERWLYGHWTFSGYGYVYQNIFRNKAAQYGIEPWYWYFVQILNQGILPFSIVLLSAIPVMVIYKPRHILTWCMIIFLLGHIVVGHKEFRFLFPMIFFFPFWALATLEFFKEKLERHQHKKWYRIGSAIFEKGFWATNTIALLLMITKPANDLIALNKVLLDNLKKETMIIYSYEFNPYVNGDTLGATFYANPLITSYCIDEYMNDTLALKGKNIWLFSEHAYARDEFMFQYAGPFFDSSRTRVLWTRLPKWTYRFNFNGWLQRSNPYTIYQLYDHPVRK